VKKKAQPRAETWKMNTASLPPDTAAAPAGTLSTASKVLLKHALAFAILNQDSLFPQVAEVEGSNPYGIVPAFTNISNNPGADKSGSHGGLRALYAACLATGANRGMLGFQALLTQSSPSEGAVQALAEKLLQNAVLTGCGSNGCDRLRYTHLMGSLWEIAQVSLEANSEVIKAHCSILLRLAAEIQAEISPLSARENSCIFLVALNRLLVPSSPGHRGVTSDGDLAAYVMQTLAEATAMLVLYPLEQSMIFITAKSLEQRLLTAATS
jgi:hypothetical protein